MCVCVLGGSRLRLDSAGPGHGSTFRLELVLPEAPEGTQMSGSPGLANRLVLTPLCCTSRVTSNAPTPSIGECRHIPEYDAHGRTQEKATKLAAAVSLPTRSTPESVMAVAGTHAEGLPVGYAGGALGAGKSKSQARLQLRFLPGFRMLHVEDDAVLRRTFELRVLKKLGVPFDVAVNGAEAVRATHDR